jgi:hypothetical protein
MSAPARVSFTNLSANTTTASFTLPAGVGELQFNPVDRNDPGTLSLINSVAATVGTIVTPMGEFPPGFGFGVLRFQTLGEAFTINVTKATQNVTIYFDEA